MKTPRRQPELRPNPNGRGALLSGGMPGNKGGTGRPPSAIRAACAVAFDKRVALLESFADDPSLPVAERQKAIDMLGKYGVGTRQDHTSADDRLEPTTLRVVYDDGDE